MIVGYKSTWGGGGGEKMHVVKDFHLQLAKLLVGSNFLHL